MLSQEQKYAVILLVPGGGTYKLDGALSADAADTRADKYRRVGFNVKVTHDMEEQLEHPGLTN